MFENIFDKLIICTFVDPGQLFSLSIFSADSALLKNNVFGDDKKTFIFSGDIDITETKENMGRKLADIILQFRKDESGCTSVVQQKHK